MATSIQTVGTHSEHFNDLDLIAITCFMIDEVQQEPEKYPLMGGLVSEWIRTLASYGPGVIDIKLDLAVSSQEVRSCFDRLLWAIDIKINGFGPVVPAALLNARCRVAGISFVDYPSVFLTEATDKLRNLVSASCTDCDPE